MKLLQIWHNGEDMGANMIYFENGQWLLCDAFYDLDTKLGSEEYAEYIKDVFYILDDGQYQGEVRDVVFTAVEFQEDEVQV